MDEKEPIKWITVNGKHIPIYENTQPQFGKAGVYKAYRAGDIFDSPMGFLTFGMERSQSYAYAKQNNKELNSYTIPIEKPLFITGEDFDEIHEKLTLEYLGKSYREGKTLEEKRAIMKQAADKISKEGYDAILMEVTDILSGQKEREIGLLNNQKIKAKRS